MRINKNLFANVTKLFYICTEFKKLCMNIKYDNNQILELHSQGLTDREIADIVGCTPNQMAKKRKRMGLTANNPITDYELTDKELAIIIGTLLGDSCIRYVHDKCNFPMLNFCHCVAQKEYFLYKKDQLINLMTSYNVYTKKSFWHKDETYELYQFNGKNMKCLLPIREAFYQNNVKIIPIDFIKKYFTEESVYYWFMDDGCYDKTSKSYTIATDCFTNNDLQKFIEFLAEKFDLHFSIKKDGELYLKHKSNYKFKEILLKYNKCDTMQYKIG